MKLQLLLEKAVKSIWYDKKVLSYLLFPFSLLYLLCIYLRKIAYRFRIFKTQHFPVPVIIVGNITVGGSGKTPLVSWLAHALQQQGWKPGIVSRGYGVPALSDAALVDEHTDPYLVGDEAVLLARQTHCPVAVSAQRVKAVEKLLEHTDANIIIADDGLQHLALGRNIEIVVIDGRRRFGNRFCLPAGPLREPKKRLRSVDFVVSKGVAQVEEWSMQLTADAFINLHNEQSLPLIDWRGKKVHAIAGIGDPEGFFAKLTDLGMKVMPHPFPDHYMYAPSDLFFHDDLPIIMTEKDAVKCRKFAIDKMWYLPVSAQLPEGLLQRILHKLPKKLK